MRHLLITILLLSLAGSDLLAQHLGRKRGFLSGAYTFEDIKQNIIPRDDWHPYPRAGEPGWMDLPEAVREAHVAEGELLINTTWEPLPANVLLEYVRDGNRSNFQGLSFARREKLAKLVLAESIENQGRFLDDIINGIWAISEETYWGVPAHLGLQAAGHGLPDVTEPTVDLFAAETASLMAWTDYLMGEKLDAVSPLIRERIRVEIDRRILTPNLERDDFWWMGFDGGLINNWNPWVNSNWLTAVLLIEEDEARRAEAIYKIIRSLDLFIDSYPEDGGCDEGPGYWSRAGGSLFDTLELLHMASDGAIDIFDKRLIREMGKYIYRSYIAGDYFINFADAGARIQIEPALVFRYGRAIDDTLMTGFAAFKARESGFGSGYIPGRFGQLNRQLPALFSLNELHNTSPLEPLLGEVWLRDIQVMTGRSDSENYDSFFIAAKGGHNDESHNHNDIGNFIIYHDGQPVIIDVGAGEYTAKTFSKDRYEIWNMQSAYHNLPTINGIMQKEGYAYKARDVFAKSDRTKVQFYLDISNAYPEEAKVKSWFRKLTLFSHDRVELQEDYHLDSHVVPFTMNYMTPRAVEVTAPGRIKLDGGYSSVGVEQGDVFMHFDDALFDVRLDEIPLTDSRLKSGWGPQLTRIVLVSKSAALEGEFIVTFSED